MAERANASDALKRIENESRKVIRNIGASIPMLANEEIEIDDLVKVKSIFTGEQNVVGVRLPRLDRIETERRAYSYFSKPYWVDLAAEKLEQAIELEIRKQIETQRVALLDEAVKTVAQRVNLFEKVLIPRAKENIKRIKIYLSDEQVSAVVRSKLAKKKRANVSPVTDQSGALA